MSSITRVNHWTDWDYAANEDISMETLEEDNHDSEPTVKDPPQAPIMDLPSGQVPNFY